MTWKGSLGQVHGQDRFEDPVQKIRPSGIVGQGREVNEDSEVREKENSIGPFSCKTTTADLSTNPALQ